MAVVQAASKSSELGQRDASPMMEGTAMWSLNSVPIKLLAVLVVVGVVLLVHQSAVGLMAVGLAATLGLGHRAARQLRASRNYL